jgi:hypothetical protein
MRMLRVSVARYTLHFRGFILSIHQAKQSNSHSLDGPRKQQQQQQQQRAGCARSVPDQIFIRLYRRSSAGDFNRGGERS